MKSAMEKLSAVGAEIYQEAQKAAQAAGASAGPAGAAGPADSGQPSAKKTEKKADVVDADFEVVDDDKKK